MSDVAEIVTGVFRLRQTLTRDGCHLELEN